MWWKVNITAPIAMMVRNQLGALGGIGEGNTEESKEKHARYKGDLPAVLVGNVAHDGVGNYAYGVQERCVDTDL